VIYRRVNYSYKMNYDHLMNSGLYERLSKAGKLVSHKEVVLDKDAVAGQYKVLCPRRIAFISYPYGWSFSMLKDAALLTLNIQKLALQYGMSLKDASAYNIQFVGSMPIFIDTLSFEIHEQGKPWVAYGQFCRQFLAPLALMSHKDVSLNQLLVSHLDGIPLPLASSLLPFKTKFSFGMYLHVHLHAKMQLKYQDEKVGAKREISKKATENLVGSLLSTVEGLKYKPQGTEWAEYYDKDVETAYLKGKKEVIESFLRAIKPVKVMDLGANNGVFSLLASEYANEVYSFDIDAACVEQNYLSLKKSGNQKVTPLVANISNPEPSIGWDNRERPRLWDRVKPDTILALALIHHLCISNNLPLGYLAKFFGERCRHLIIEWVPKEDDKVRRLLQNRKDIFEDYVEAEFTYQFTAYFSVVDSIELPLGRKLFLFEKKVDVS